MSILPAATTNREVPPQAGPGVSRSDWSDWRWQLRHRITTLRGLSRWINITPGEQEAIERSAGRYRWSITPYYASLMDPDDPACPIRQQAVPAIGEFLDSGTADVDPVGDMSFRKTNRVVHKYPDRVIILITEACPVYCRHCTRKFHTTNLNGTYFRDNEGESFDEDLRYIAEHPEIRDVLLTGGDPLSYPDRKLDEIISGIRAIPSVEIIRIGSRFPVLLPHRITDEFCEMLAQYHPIWFNTHFNHPDEITPESAAAVDRLLRSGVPVGNQTVLLKGINDNVRTMRDLMTKLLSIRVRPYYLYHCDDVVGVSHFMTTIEKGLEIMEGLQGHITGFGVPQYVLTTPVGKIPISNPYHEPTGSGLLLRNYAGQQLRIDGDPYNVSPRPHTETTTTADGLES